MNKYDEFILVAPTDKIFQHPETKESFYFQGINTDVDQVALFNANYEKHHSYKRRGDMEEDPTFKQLIPYTVLVSTNDKATEHTYFVYKRLSGGGEERLHNQYSLGVGGHMNHIVSDNFRENFFENYMRELTEELVLEDNQMQDQTPFLVGYINDDQNEVGKVHLGAVVMAQLPKGLNVEVRETDTLEGMFMTAEELREHADQFESWSQFVIKEIDSLTKTFTSALFVAESLAE